MSMKKVMLSAHDLVNFISKFQSGIDILRILQSKYKNDDFEKVVSLLEENLKAFKSEVALTGETKNSHQKDMT